MDVVSESERKERRISTHIPLRSENLPTDVGDQRNMSV
jgi:hypothetical protein